MFLIYSRVYKSGSEIELKQVETKRFCQQIFWSTSYKKTFCRTRLFKGVNQAGKRVWYIGTSWFLQSSFERFLMRSKSKQIIAKANQCKQCKIWFKNAYGNHPMKKNGYDARKFRTKPNNKNEVIWLPIN